MALMIYGCAISKKENNIERLSDTYYKKTIIDSNNLKNTKAFLAENNIKFNTYTLVNNAETGSFGNILINGVRKNFVNKGVNDWVKANNIELEKNELSGFYFNNKEIDKIKPLKNGKYFYTVACTDFTHAELALNNETIVLPFTYLLTVLTKENARSIDSTTKYWSCDGYEFEEVIYKKNIKVSTTLSSSKITYDFKKGETAITEEDKLFIIAKDAIEKASIEKLNDVEMLQAWKDYLVTLNASNNEKLIKVKEESKPIIKQESEEVKGLDDAKNNCKELGFKVGSKEFGNCVLKLAK